MDELGREQCVERGDIGAIEREQDVVAELLDRCFRGRLRADRGGRAGAGGHEEQGEAHR